MGPEILLYTFGHEVKDFILFYNITLKTNENKAIPSFQQKDLATIRRISSRIHRVWLHILLFCSLSFSSS